MALANTTWNYNDGSGASQTMAFGPSQTTTGNPGGWGVWTVNTIPTTTMWMEDGNGNFMIQIAGPTTNDALPSYTGVYKNDTALGWGSNFEAAWGTWSFTMKKTT